MILQNRDASHQVLCFLCVGKYYKFIVQTNKLQVKKITDIL